MKYTVIEVATGKRIRAHGVDAREMVAKGGGAYKFEGKDAAAVPATAAPSNELAALRLAPALQAALAEAGYTTLSSIAEATPEALTEVKGIGEKMAPRLIADALAAVNPEGDPQ